MEFNQIKIQHALFTWNFNRKKIKRISMLDLSGLSQCLVEW